MASFAQGPIGGPSSVCVGSTVTVTDSTTGGWWAVRDTTIASVSYTSGVVYGIAPGVTVISYTVGTTTVTKSFTVNPLPAVITGSSTLSVGGTTPLSDATPGGTWTSSCPSILTVNATTGVVTGVGTGVCNVYYVLPTGCARSFTINVTGGLSPISGITHACVGQTSTLSDSTTGGTWSSSNTGVATIGLTSGVVTGVSAGTTMITYIVSTRMVTTVFTVYPNPSAISGPTTVGVGSSMTLTDATSGGTWSSSNTAVATVGISTGLVTGVAPGVCTIYYTLSTGCRVSYVITVTGGATPGPIGGTTSFCVGTTSTLTDSVGGGSWTSSNTGVATVGSSTGVVTGVAAGTATITYRIGTSFVTTIVTISPAPAAISGSSSVAAGSSITLTDATGGGTWSSSNPSVATVGLTTGIVTGVLPGVVNIYYTLGSGCSAVKTVTVTGTFVAPIMGTASVCVGSTRTLTDSTTGGRWSSSNTAVATVGSSTGVVTGVATGVVTISYTVGTTTVTRSFTVNPVPSAIGGPTTVATGSTITLTDATPGGTWTSGNPAVATVGLTSGVVTGVSAGTVGIYYVLSTGCGAYRVITVTAGGITPITGTPNVCVGSTRALANATTGGTWSSSNTAIATVGATTGVVTGITAGVVTISYTVGTVTTTMSFTVNPTPSAIAGPTTVTVGSSITKTDATSGGTWSSSNAGIATINATTGVATGVSVGTVTIYYLLSTGCGVSSTLTVTSGTTIAPITGANNVCVGNTTTLSDATSGGTWSSSNTGIATIGLTTGVVTGISAGTVIITYRVGSSAAYYTFTVNNPPLPIGGSSSVCVGSTITLTDSTFGGSWISSNTGVATIGSSTGVLTGVAPGVTNIYYVRGGCGVYKTVTVNATPSAISGSGSTCLGSTITLTNGTTGGRWSSGNTGIATVGSSTGVVTALAAGVVNIYYSIGTCGTFKTLTITPAPAAIAGPSSVCVGSTITLTDTTRGGIWLSTTTGVATVGTGTGVVTGVSAGVVNIYYTIGSCGVYKSLTVTPTPSAISGPTNVCVGSSITLTDATSGGRWSSGNSAIATVGSSTGVVTGVTVGVVNIYYAIGACGVYKTVNVNPTPAVIGGPTTVAVSGIITLTDAVSGGIWMSGDNSIATVDSLTGEVTGQSVGTVNIYYVIGGCGTFVTITVTDLEFRHANPNGGISTANDITVFPNPTSGSLNIKWQDKATGAAKVVVSDMAGRVVYATEINIDATSGQTQISLGNLANGVYLIAIKSDNVNYNGKLTVQQ